MSEMKEIFLKDAIAPVSIKSTEIILDQMKNCVCKIHKGKINGTGFFIRISYNNKLYDLLITNNHVLKEEDIMEGNIINISLNNEEIFRNIKIDSKRKRYTNEILDVTIIEINEDIDNIKDLILLQEKEMKNINNMINKKLYKY